MKTLLFADGGPEVGLGHATRCVALAQSLLESATEPLITFEQGSGLEDYIRTQGCPYKKVSSDYESIQNIITSLNATALVIDSYRWTREDFSRFRGGPCKVVVFDDEGTRQLPVDGIVNGAISANELRFNALPDTKLYLGPRYQVIRNSFINLPVRHHLGWPRRIIALVGGSDPHGLLPKLYNALEDFSIRRSELTVEIICGPFVDKHLIRSSQHTKVIVNPKDLPIRMASADIAISASGQTLFELAKCGTPTIGFISGEDQQRNLSDFERVGFLINTGDARMAAWIDRLKSALLLLANNSELRRKMSCVGRELIDGMGSKRLADEIFLLSCR